MQVGDALVFDRFLLALVVLFLSTASVAIAARADVVPPKGQDKLLPLYPARPTFGSGTVFRLNRSVDGSRYVRVLCRNLFAGVTSERAPYSVKSTLFREPEQFEKATGILYGVLTNAQQTAENLRTKRARSVKLSYEDAVLERLPAAIKLGGDGAAYPLDPVCLDVLARIKAQDDPDPLYLVDRAVAISRFRVEVERGAESTTDAVDIIDVNVDYVSYSKGRDVVEIEAPYYVEMSAVAIVDIGPPVDGADPNTRQVKTGAAQFPLRYRSWE
jgi:hypothetical protein